MTAVSERFSTALLEKLAHGSGWLPPNQHYVEIIVPPGVSYEMFDIAAHPGWDMATGAVSKPYGETWQQSKRSLVLIVPSVVARPDMNVLINPEHPEFPRVTHGPHRPVYWDKRLFP